ncbi:hypothetical protein Q8A73_018208 [Channa argus]|nr:hypothetical protein Q8A73_018208 [Channa argus]
MSDEDIANKPILIKGILRALHNHQLWVVLNGRDDFLAPASRAKLPGDGIHPPPTHPHPPQHVLRDDYSPAEPQNMTPGNNFWKISCDEQDSPVKYFHHGLLPL